MLDYRLEAVSIISAFKQAYQRGFEAFLRCQDKSGIATLAEFSELYKSGAADEWVAYVYKNGWLRFENFSQVAWNSVVDRHKVQLLRSIIQLCEFHLDLPIDENSDAYYRLIRPVEILEERCRDEAVFEFIEIMPRSLVIDKACSIRLGLPKPDATSLRQEAYVPGHEPATSRFRLSAA